MNRNPMNSLQPPSAVRNLTLFRGCARFQSPDPLSFKCHAVVLNAVAMSESGSLFNLFSIGH